MNIELELRDVLVASPYNWKPEGNQDPVNSECTDPKSKLEKFTPRIVRTPDDLSEDEMTVRDLRLKPMNSETLQSAHFRSTIY